MKRNFTLLLGLILTCLPLVAQSVDRSFIFVDEDGQEIADGATVARDTFEDYGDGAGEIKSNVSVKNLSAAADDYLKVKYVVSQLDNGIYQICFPTSCNMKDEVGSYETSPGQLMGDVQNIMSEWFPTDDGMCIVTLSIEVLTKTGGFPVANYVHKADGPCITIKFVKGGSPEPKYGDVNGDGEVNISDINAVISIILHPETVNDKADVNGDGEVNISDINAVITIILNIN